MAEYGVNRDFIVKGIRAGKLEYHDEVIWNNPYLRAGYVRTCKGFDATDTGKMGDNIFSYVNKFCH